MFPVMLHICCKYKYIHTKCSHNFLKERIAEANLSILLIQARHWYYPRLYASQAATKRCSKEKVFWKWAANLQENAHAEVQFQ